jgi:polysaccharide export outer membrane protein
MTNVFAAIGIRRKDQLAPVNGTSARPSMLLAMLMVLALAGRATAAEPDSVREPYRVQPGDILTVSVWKEDGLTGDVFVRPDGGLSFPLAGDISASGKSVEDLRKEITERLKRYMPQPVVTVAVKQIGGNHVYVLGKVNKPGDFQFTTPIDVMQALSLASGTTPYAALNDIIVLRRENDHEQVMHFRYGDVERGRELSQNVLLHSGDTVVVP